MATEKKEKIVVVGFGWVGQANALALSFMGYPVFYFDIGTPVPKYGKEWGKEYGKVRRLANVLEEDSADTWYLLSVGDRVSPEGIQDVSLIVRASETLSSAKGGVILRSTVLPEHLSKINYDYYLPEFLHEQYAVDECLNPFYLVIGYGETARREPEFLREWERRAHKTFRGSAKEASFIKYLSNIWNALRISFTNEMGDIISKGGQDKATATRVLDFLFEEKAYLRYGRAYGGHCLPKDTLALSRSYAEDAVIIRAIHDSNERHQRLTANANLPEWFSRWEFEGGIEEKLGRVWKALRVHPLVKPLRRALRPVRRLLGRFAPKRSLQLTKRLWNKLARKHPLYFSHPGTESGRKVNEYEFRESGRAEYERLFKKDPLSRTFKQDTHVALDLGTGAGRHLEFFARDFKHVIGVDISEEMLRVAGTRLSGLRNITLLPTDGRQLPVPDSSVDFIFSREMFQSISDERVITSYLSELFRVIRQGGIAKIEVRAERSAYPWLYTHGLFFTQSEARTLFERAGFNVTSVTPEGMKHLWVTAKKPWYTVRE